MSEMVYCRTCGKRIQHTVRVCPECGAIQFTENRGGRDRISAALFAFFLGAFGAHKFYLGRTGQGILYAVFFWTFIPYVVSFIEFILLLCMTDEEFYEKYGDN